MIQGLVTALEILAAPADIQIRRHPDRILRTDELALEYADAWRLAQQCPGLEFTTTQRELLGTLDDTLDTMHGAANAGFWTAERLREDSTWATVRRMASDALHALGTPARHPPT